MRMRKKKHSEQRLSACLDYIYKTADGSYSDPALPINMPSAPVFLEIGAGKGGFACKMAARHSEVAYIAMERVTDCVVLAAERAASGELGELKNLRFLIDTADNLTKLFAPGTVDAIFLNFSDPWPKKGYAKRRLTHRRYLAVYMNLLREGGTLTFKTDNVDLFDFSLEEISAVELPVVKLTRDLHTSEWAADNIMTEYEKNFSDQGMKINMVSVVKPEGFALQIPDDLKPDRKVYGR